MCVCAAGHREKKIYHTFFSNQRGKGMCVYVCTLLCGSDAVKAICKNKLGFWPIYYVFACGGVLVQQQKSMYISAYLQNHMCFENIENERYRTSQKYIQHSLHTVKSCSISNHPYRYEWKTTTVPKTIYSFRIFIALKHYRHLFMFRTKS